MRKKKIFEPDGICKLTLKKGKFVQSHILPRALTILSRTGEKAVQASLKTPMKKHFQGWYDNKLCIADGEYILSQIDNKAITILRKNLLVWSSWPNNITELNSPDIIEPAKNDNQNYGFRIIKKLDWKPIKLFMLSILWRSAASEREEMDTVNISSDLLEKLRIAIINYDSLSMNEFPVRLYQIVNKIAPHNRTPIMEEDTIEYNSSIGIGSKKYTICRIYLDGLIAYITLDPDQIYLDYFKKVIIGGNNETMIILHTIENSRTFNDLLTVINYD